MTFSVPQWPVREADSRVNAAYSTGSDGSSRRGQRPKRLCAAAGFCGASHLRGGESGSPSGRRPRSSQQRGDATELPGRRDWAWMGCAGDGGAPSARPRAGAVVS